METVGDFLNVFNVEVSRFSVTLSLCFIFLGLLYWYSTYPFSVLSRCGIKHPKPVPLLGNLLMFRKGFLKPHSEIIKTHGKVCGYYLGLTPVVLIADPDMLRKVLVKDFSKFPNRMKYHTTNKLVKNLLIMLRNEQWRRVRSVLTPSFSAAKLKEMVPLINIATDSLMNKLNVHAESGEAFDIHKCFGCFTMDVIASVGFGTQLDSQNNPDDPFLHQAKVLLTSPFFDLFSVFSFLFPRIMDHCAKFIPNKRELVYKFFVSSIQKIIKQRDELPPDQRRRDVLQLMLDARAGEDGVSLEHFDITDHSDESENRSQQTQPPGFKQKNVHLHPEESHKRHQQRKTITEDEVVSQSFVILLAGYETSTSTLAFTCYLLALHPECQLKVQEEVDDFFTKHDATNYTNVQELKYLDMVVCEALRLYPPGFRFPREVDNDCVVDGQFFPKGATLNIPTSYLHYNPEYWSEPEKFIPERFTPEATANRHPFVYLPFGAGPRSCIGVKLAQLEIRMALVHLFHRFSLKACSETKVPPDLKSFFTLGPKNGIFLKITRRDEREGKKDSPSTPVDDLEKH